jgi:cell wall-associated NlpC family hydrolase
MGPGAVLDDVDRDLMRLVAGVGVAVGLTLLIAVILPLVIFSGFLAAFVPLRLVSPLATPLAAPSTSAVGLSRASAPIVVPVPIAGDAVQVARGYLGVPYVFGGTNPAVGLDCSGLVQLVYRQLGITLPRTAQQQFDATVRIGRDQLQPGDLVFFARTYPDPRDWITHVGIYAGDGLQVNAPTPGQKVSIQPVFSGFWGAHFVSGGRVRGAVSSNQGGPTE